MTRKLYKSRNDRMIDGVCGGIAEYFDIDSTLVRLGLVVFCAVGGSGFIAYLLVMIIIPSISIFIIGQKQLIRGMFSGAVKG